MTARMLPAQKGRNPGPGSCQSPISTVRAYKAKKIPTAKKKMAATRLYWLWSLAIFCGAFKC